MSREVQLSNVRKHTAAHHERSALNTVFVIATCFFAMSLNTASITSCNISLIDIGQDLHIQQDSLDWISGAFALSSGCTLLLCGRLADLYGRKLAFLVGVAWVAIFALGCGFAKTAVQLLILRGLQGIGSAASITAAVGILAQSFPPGTTRSIAFATFSAGAPFGGAIGFNLGGVITQFSAVGWRGAFYICAGIAAGTFLIGLLSIDYDKPSKESDRRVDWIGAALITVGLAFIIFVLGRGGLAPQGWRTPYIIILLVLGVLLMVAFLLWEDFLDKNSTRPPLVCTGILTRANGKFVAILLIAFLQWSAFMSWMMWVQLYYQTYKKYSLTQIMLRLLPTSIIGLTLNFIVGLVVGRVPAIYLLVIGTLATGIACLLFAIINVDSPYWAYAFPSTVLIVWGADFIFSCGSLFVSCVALPHEQSVAGGIFSTFMQLGIAFGLAITTTVQNAVASKEALRLGIVSNAEDANMPLEAQLEGYRAAQWTGFGFAMGALALSILLFRGVGILGRKEEAGETTIQGLGEPPTSEVER